METNLIEIKNMVQAMSDPVQVAAAWVTMHNAKQLLKKADDILKKFTLDIMKEQDVKEIILGDGRKVYRDFAKKECYETEAIYKALDFTEKQQAVLPKNPAWRKSAILANKKTAGAWSQDISEVVVLKEIDENLMKALGRGPQ